MAGWVNRRVTTVVGTAVAVLVVGLDAHLLLDLLG
jgi:manganese transport protein